MRFAFGKHALYYAFLCKQRDRLLEGSLNRPLTSWLTNQLSSWTSTAKGGGDDAAKEKGNNVEHAVNASDSTLAFSSSDFVRHVLVPTPYHTSDLLQLISDSLPSNASMAAHDLVELGSVWYLPAGVGTSRISPLAGKPMRLNSSLAMKTVAPGDYLRIHFNPRRFPIAHQADWRIPVESLQSNRYGQWVERNHDDKSVIVGQGRGWLILNKPSGLPCHSTVDNVRENVIGCLQAGNPGWSYFTPPQRLDHNTSGLLVVSTDKVFAGYYAQLLRYKTSRALNETSIVEKSAIDKRYRCLVCLSENTVKFRPGQVLRHFLEPSIRAPKRFVDCPPPGEDWPECLTRISRVRGPFLLDNATELVEGLWSLGAKPANCVAVAELEVELLTGRTHQIRGQLAASGVPIVGDIPYGGAYNINHTIHFEPTDRLALQCYELSFVDPNYLNETSWRLSQRRNRFRLKTAWWTVLLPRAARSELLPPRVQLSVGRHKYVLIKAVDPTDNASVEWFVKSAAPFECGGAHHGKDASSHIQLCSQDSPGHVAQEFRAWIEAAGFKASVQGGGFIDYDPVAGTVYVYGTSYGFGQADHCFTSKVLSSWNSTLSVSTDDVSGFFG